MDPKSLFLLKSRLTQLMKDEKLKLWNVPRIFELVKFNSVTLPSSLQVIPCHLHGLVVLAVGTSLPRMKVRIRLVLEG